MSVVSTSLGWKCDESFLVSTAGRKLASIGVASPVTKLNAGDAICCQLILSNGDMGPVLISTVENNEHIIKVDNSSAVNLRILFFIKSPPSNNNIWLYYITINITPQSKNTLTNLSMLHIIVEFVLN